MKNFKNKYGSYALVTGASSGIGLEFSEQLAQLGMNLVLVARRKDKLKQLAQNLIQKYGIEVKTIAMDLLEDEAVIKLNNQTNDLEIGLVIPNAGMELHGNFLNGELKDETRLIHLNITIPMQIAKVFARKMAKRKRGGILFLSSTFGFQSVPYFANYAASKAYILTLGQALRVEMKKNGVDVSVLAPGLTKTAMTETMQKQGMNFKKMPIAEMTTKRLVKKALTKMGKRSLIIAGKWNNFMGFMGKYMTPRFILASMFGFLVNRAMDKKQTQFSV